MARHEVETAFGAPLQRREDLRLVTGRGRYTDDLGGPASEAAFVRSEHAHARVVDIDVSGALEVDGVEAIFTYEDLDDGVAEPAPLLREHPGITALRTQYALARDEVRYAGQPVVAVIARDRYTAEDAAARIRVRYELLSPLVDVERAARDDANVAGGWSEEAGDVAAALRDAPHVFELRLEIERSAAMPMEGRAVYARYDAEDDRLFVYDTTQVPTGIRSGLARMLGMDNERVEVVAPDIGGAFGMKGMRFYSEEVVVPWAARRLGRPVRWTEDRREQFIGSNHERGQVHTVTAGCDDEGRLLALDVNFLHDTGAYLPYGLIVPLNTVAHLQGPYRIPNFRYDFRAIYTHTLPTSPYRGGGRPQGVFVIERVMDRVAAALGIDRAEVRRRNLIEPGAMPYDLRISGQDGSRISYDSGDYGTGLERLMELSGYAEFEAERSRAAAEGRRIGVGIACFVEGSGMGPFEGAVVDVLADGTVTVASGVSSQGQSHETTFAQIAADELGVRVDDVRVVVGDTRRIAHGIGTFASRAAVVGGSAVKNAAREVRERAVELAARTLEAEPDDIVIEDGSAVVRGSPASAIPLGRLAEMARVARLGGDGSPGLGATNYHSPDGWTWGFGMHAAVVEIDRETCAVKVLRYVILDDCGRVINPLVVKGQVIGAFAQGIGGALYEQIAYDDDGQIQNASFMDFLMPYATEVPRPQMHHMETPSPRNEMGIKGVGEAGILPVSAALASAIEDAAGVVIERMPITPVELFEMTSGQP
ncbi:MAG: aerobic carbon-monoxide dehydrogenase large subunit [Thermoleophilales bacterium]|nr:aerobic carbon-monoxide dehydrogenase large subunit [Thermoleophilales bacterium]